MAFTLLFVTTATAQALPSADEIIARSIAWHDPEGLWYHVDHTFELEETRPNGPSRFTRLQLNHCDQTFHLEARRPKDTVIATLDAEGCDITLNGSGNIPAEKAERYRLSCEGIAWWKDYYAYMHGLPMKLKEE